MGKKQEPQTIQAMYENAVSLHQQGDLKQAVRLYSHIVSCMPDIAAVHYNLGLALFELEQFEDAVTACLRAAELSPDDPDIFYNLGLACKKTGMHDKAEQAYLTALALAPGDPDVLYNLGCCYLDAGAVEHAGRTFEDLVSLKENHVSALNNLAYINHLLGDYARAKELYGQVIKLAPDRRSARYMYNALSGAKEKAPPREYIRELFDRYSESYDQSLVEKLECSLYSTMRKICDETAPRKTEYKQGLDLGCGTGLSGEAFRSACRHLSGVDLSRKMIEKAGQKNIYDELYCDDIVEFLSTSGETYELLIAADVLPYLGDLAPLLETAASTGGKEAVFCLSCEAATEPGWILQPSGRYAHHPDYIRKTAEQTGWNVLHTSPTDIRKEKKEWIRGYVFILTRQQ
jgi:predicted TPR repeat methyltransferase